MHRFLRIIVPTILSFLCLHAELSAQKISGIVYEKDLNGEKVPLPGANIYWSDFSEAVQADEQGRFEIGKGNADTLIVTFIGYTTQKLTPEDGDKLKVILSKGSKLVEVEIVGRQSSTYVSTLNPIKTEIITTKELCKAACCNLSESFETNNTVDVLSTDAITGTKRIEMLGLAGVYTQVLKENLPQMRGLLTNSGFGQIPGTFVESIQISKGVGSVVNGFESIAGQINLELKKPGSEEFLHLNGYINEMGRSELNFFKENKHNNQWSSAILVHGSFMEHDFDRNNDGFMDAPESKKWNFENRWKYKNENMIAQFGIHAFQEEKTSGTTHALNETTNEHAWLFQKNVTRLDGFAKVGWTFSEKEYKSFALLGNAFYLKDNTLLDSRRYDATQKSAYLSGIYQNRIGEHDAHSFRTGFNVQYDDFEEYFTGNPFLRKEIVAGSYFEYTFKGDRSTLMAGLRGDYNSLFGAFFTPRLHYKFTIAEETIFRLSGGRGQRTANIIHENLGFLASSRQLVIQTATNDAASGFGLLPEVAWNTGGGINHAYSISNRPGSLSADVYYTWFERQTVVDLDASPQQLLFYNLRGESYALSAQLDWNQEITRFFELRLSYKYTDAKTKFTTGILDRPFIAAHRGLFNLAYHSRKDKWMADVTINYVSSKRMPNSRSNPLEFQMRERSPDYAVMNTQITRNLKNWAIYIGVENIFNTQQQVQIISPENPHNEFFDSSYVWGPTFGRLAYAGFRYIISNK